MTLLAELGDRSQFATVVLASQENLLGTCVGGVAGHVICTGLAVAGGKMLAEKISVNTGKNYLIQWSNFLLVFFGI